MNEKKGSYTKNAIYAAIGRVAPLAIQLISTPFIIAVLGVDSFAIWAILATTISLMLTADLGVVGIMQRYHSMARGINDKDFGGRITASVLLFLLFLLILITVLGPYIADFFVSIFKIAPGLEGTAWLVFRYAGTLSVLQLISLALIGYLSAQNRFAETAYISLGARLVFVAGIVISLNSDVGLLGLLIASFADALAAILLSVAFCWKHLLLEVRGFVSKSEFIQLWSYSWKNQASALGFVAQRESDVIIAAIMLPVAMQATIAASAQLAAALAFAPTILLIPLFTQLSSKIPQGAEGTLRSALAAERNWFVFVIPFMAIILSIAPFGALAWFGPQLPDLIITMFLLSLGFLLVLINSVRAVFVRSIGKPGIESISYFWMLIIKLTVGIPATFFYGIYGLAASTVVASIASVFVLWRKTTKYEIAFLKPKIGLQTYFFSAILFLFGVSFSLVTLLLVQGRISQLFVFALIFIISLFALFVKNKNLL